TDKTCPKCGRPVVIKLGRFGRFYSCTGFKKTKKGEPQPPGACDYAEPLEGQAEPQIEIIEGKMLPFDNKSEFQVIVDMPNGTTLEETARVTEWLAEETQKQREVVNVETYVGTASPYNFNGLVRHYYLQRGPNVADIQVNLL